MKTLPLLIALALFTANAHAIRFEWVPGDEWNPVTGNWDSPSAENAARFGYIEFDDAASQTGSGGYKLEAVTG